MNSLYAGGFPFGTVTTTTTPAIKNMASTTTTKTRYFHTDHLGSIVAITDETGTVVERRSYDAWGKRRNINGTAMTNAFFTSEERHGFTGHEELDEVGLIHMNGRLYDPATGKFISVDPEIQFPDDMQSFNAYSYLMNNPFIGTDPSGFDADFSMVTTGDWGASSWVISYSSNPDISFYLTGGGGSPSGASKSTGNASGSSPTSQGSAFTSSALAKLRLQVQNTVTVDQLSYNMNSGRLNEAFETEAYAYVIATPYNPYVDNWLWSTITEPFGKLAALGTKDHVNPLTHRLENVNGSGRADIVIGGIASIGIPEAKLIEATAKGLLTAAKNAAKRLETDAVKEVRSTKAEMAAMEEARYMKYWERYAPEQSSPYSIYKRYTEKGEIKQVTTYDKFGNRHRQYDLQDSRRGEHQHNFDYGATLPRPKGARSDHFSINE